MFFISLKLFDFKYKCILPFCFCLNVHMLFILNKDWSYVFSGEMQVKFV